MTRPPKSPEMQFLAHCLPLIRDGADKFYSIDPLIDWNKLVSLAGHHGFLPMLSQKLAQNRWQGVPSDYRKILQTYQRNNTRRSHVWSAALTEFQDQCRQQGIPIMSWKGPLLGLELYGSITLREYADLDFLVRHEDLKSLIQLLSTLGYAFYQKDSDKNALQSIETQDEEFCFLRASDGVYLELHTQLMPSRFPGWQDAEDYFLTIRWQPRLRTWSFRLPPEKLLLSLCGHGLKHVWERLKWLADIAMLVERYRDLIDWEELLRKSTEEDKVDVLLHSLWLASEVFAVVLPVAVVRAARGRTAILELTEVSASRLMSGQLKEEHDEGSAGTSPSSFHRMEPV